MSVLPDTAAFADASKVIKGLARIPAPLPTKPLPAQSKFGVSSCAKDYSVKCPSGFVNVGAIYGGTKERINVAYVFFCTVAARRACTDKPCD